MIQTENEPDLSCSDASSELKGRRVTLLWSKVRRAAVAVSKFNRLNNKIRQLGARPTVCHRTLAGKDVSEDTPPAKCILHPKTRMKRIWDVVILLLLMWTAFVLPFRLCFYESVSETIYIIEIVVDALFFVDIIINFFSAYYDKFENLVTDKKKIAKKYLRSWFIIDLLGCFPFQLMEVDGDQDQSYNKLLRLIRLNRFARILRIVRLFKMVRLFRSKASMVRFLQKLKTNYGATRLIYFLFSSIIIVHVLACFWFFLGKFDDDENTWVIRYQMENADVGEQYLTSLYWVFATLTSVGYGDIFPYTNLEKIFGMTVMVFGFGFYSYVIGNISNIISNMDHEVNQREIRISAFNELAKAINLPGDLLDRVKTNIYFLHNPKYYNKWDQSAFIKALPLNLRSTVSQCLHEEFTKNILFFKNRHELLLLFAVPKLKVSQLLYKDAVYFEGDLAEEVYFVNLGRVVFRANNGVIYRHYSQGSYFGDIEVLKGESRMDTVQVWSENAIFYILGKDHFFEMMKEFPDVDAEIHGVASVREIRHNEAKEHALKLVPSNTSEIFAKVDNDLQDSQAELPVLNKLDTYEEVKYKFRNERSMRYQFLWENARLGRDFATVQNTFVNNMYLTNKSMYSKSPKFSVNGEDGFPDINESSEFENKTRDFNTLEEFFDIIKERPICSLNSYRRNYEGEKLIQHLDELIQNQS